MSLKKRLLIYSGILGSLGIAVASVILRDFAATSFPPDLTLAAYEPHTTLVVPQRQIWRPKFPVIDIHSHPQQSEATIDELVQVMDEAGVKAVVDLFGHWGVDGARLERLLTAYRLKYPERFIVFTNIDLDKIDAPNDVAEECAKFERAVAMGAKGVKVWKDLGMMERDNAGQMVAIDDPRLDGIWEKIGELKIPVLIHSADPAAFWQPFDRFNERYEEIAIGGGWLNSYANSGYPSREALLSQREGLLKKHPNTIFIGAHMGEMANDLRALGKLFDQYPNFYVDISDRINELGRQPYTARDFFIKYQDRILFGIDLYPETHVYQDYYRFLETKDEYFDYPRHYFKHGRWKIYGIGLPDAVLEKVYYQNAARLLRLKDF